MPICVAVLPYIRSNSKPTGSAVWDKAIFAMLRLNVFVGMLKLYSSFVLFAGCSVFQL